MFRSTKSTNTILGWKYILSGNSENIYGVHTIVDCRLCRPAAADHNLDISQRNPESTNSESTVTQQRLNGFGQPIPDTYVYEYAGQFDKPAHWSRPFDDLDSQFGAIAAPAVSSWLFHKTTKYQLAVTLWTAAKRLGILGRIDWTWFKIATRPETVTKKDEPSQ